ncbi:hypothetical protein GGR54DRAFT_598555 [Hypoxylon sp. NC1633]|nr:hypothetical protein GGR54DRAFT_598555 [Hypoxylon sp. NC1633]
MNMSLSTPFPNAFTLCRRCLLRSLASRRAPGRAISTSFLEKQKEALNQWDERAKLIEDGKLPHLWDQLKERGYVKDTAGAEEQIRELMRRKRIGAYVGIDPTAPSLHVGHLLPLMPLFWMYINGYRAISVIGGATARVGDPTDRLQSRDPIRSADMTMNVTKVHYQLKRIWLNVEEQARRFGYEKQRRIWSRAILNNNQWYNTTTFVEVVARMFKGLRLGPMLSRDTVKRKMEKGDGMSLDEFVYPLMQAWDWWYLFRKRDVLMQIGGSDQYGNIVTGIESIKYMRDTEPNPAEALPDNLLFTPVGFTVPLLTDSSGAKFGKSSGNAIWLDQFMTSSFDLYGYFMRRPDADVENLLKLFTFLPLEQINKIMDEQNKDPSQRPAHHALAFEVVALVHGIKEANNTQHRHMGLFSKKSVDEVTSYPQKNGVLPTANLASAFQVDIKLPESLILGKSISRILYAAGLADSNADANRLTQHQGAYIGGAPGQQSATNAGMPPSELMFTPIKNWFPQDTKNFLIDGQLLLLRRGKHFVRVVRVVSDAEWQASGLTYPGEPGTGRMRRLREALVSAAKDKNLNLGDRAAVDKFLDGAVSMYTDRQGALRYVSRESESISHDRARQILAQSILPFRQDGPQSAQQKTAAIDDVLARARESYTAFGEDQERAEIKAFEKKEKDKARERRVREREERGGEGW